MHTRIRKIQRRNAENSYPSQLETYVNYRKELYDFDRYLYKNLDNWILFVSGSVFAFYVTVAENLADNNYLNMGALKWSLGFSCASIVLIIFSKYYGMMVARHKIRMLDKTCEDSEEHEIMDNFDKRNFSKFNKTIDFIVSAMSFIYLLCFVISLTLILIFATSNIPTSSHRSTDSENSALQNGGGTTPSPSPAKTNTKDTEIPESTAKTETDDQSTEEVAPAAPVVEPPTAPPSSPATRAPA